MFRRMYSALISAKRALSAFSCRYARTMRTPERFSCVTVVRSPKCACTASNRSCTWRPSRSVTTGSRIIGRRASAVSRALISSMNASAITPPNTVFVRYMMAGPAAMRTAPRSFVSLAMISPVRVRPYHAASSVSRCTKSASLRSFSIFRLTPFSCSRICQRNTATTSVIATISAAMTHTSRGFAPARIPSIARRMSVGMALYSVTEITTASRPNATCPR